MNDDVKMSVFLNKDLHRRLKMQSLGRDLSLQKVVVEAISKHIDDPLPEVIPNRKIAGFLDRFRAVLESDDKTAQDMCLYSLKGAEALLRIMGNNAAFASERVAS